jgi:hypothetical protein
MLGFNWNETTPPPESAARLKKRGRNTRRLSHRAKSVA